MTADLLCLLSCVWPGEASAVSEAKKKQSRGASQKSDVRGVTDQSHGHKLRDVILDELVLICDAAHSALRSPSTLTKRNDGRVHPAAPPSLSLVGIVSPGVGPPIAAGAQCTSTPLCVALEWAAHCSASG